MGIEIDLLTEFHHKLQVMLNNINDMNNTRAIMSLGVIRHSLTTELVSIDDRVSMLKKVSAGANSNSQEFDEYYQQRESEE